MASFTILVDGDIIPFREAMPASPEEAYGVDGSRVQTQYLVPWAKRYKARQGLLGTVTRKTTAAAVAYISRVAPHALVYAPWLYCTVVTKIAGEAPRRMNANGTPNYVDARIYATYEDVEWNYVNDADMIGPDGVPDESSLVRNIIFDQEDSLEHLVIRAGTWKWLAPSPSEGRTLTQDIGVPYPSSVLHYTWVQVPRTCIDRVTIAAMIGKTNDAFFDFCAPNTLIFMAPKYQSRRLPDGTRASDVSFFLKHYPRGVNFRLDPTDGNWYEIGRGAQRPIQAANFRLVFRSV